MLGISISCSKDTKPIEQNNQTITLDQNEINEPSEETQERENSHWILDYDWSLADGRFLVNPSIEQADWIGYKTPRVFFYKFSIPEGSDLYQVRLRDELFYFLYQTEDKTKLHPIGKAFGTEVFDLEFRNNLSTISLTSNNIPYGLQNRIGQQIDMHYPLVGVWGQLPSLDEYKLVNSEDCLFYMEIDRKIPDYAVRKGTYLFKQLDDKTFESISSFPDGLLRLEVRNETQLILTPLFTLPDEYGSTSPLIMSCNPYNPRFSLEEEY
jgi:hypothetical protein